MSRMRTEHWIGADPLRHDRRIMAAVDSINVEIDNGETLLRHVMEHQFHVQLGITERDYRSVPVLVQQYIDSHLAYRSYYHWDSDLAEEYSEEMYELLYPYCEIVRNRIAGHVIPVKFKGIPFNADLLDLQYSARGNNPSRDLHLCLKWRN